MKPGAFEYVAPESLEAALAVLTDRGEDASILSGGQSLLPLLNMRLARPEVLLDINRLGELATWEVTGDEVRVGALVRAARLERDAEVLATLPVLPEAISHIGHPQIRNRTTVGGNVAHADPSSELPGVLAALDGSVELRSQSGTRTLSWDEFFVSVFTTAREPEELVIGVRFPLLRGWDVRFTEMARRHGDFPIVALTVAVQEDGGVLTGLRAAATGVADRPVRLTEVEQAATGRSLDDAVIADLAGLARDAVDPQPDGAGSAEYRKHLVGTLLSRVLAPELGRSAA
ncbi:xanthine dehydrogenase family protein subunit M [Geodermatophilus sp. DF01-2]|uniref:FAD binding domain-containing protein n=1 Tax=Geodermatophilus sp. DF01-2 TaxID=2559610 RepID=UPI0014305426|nr:xanthine dehydrogenase family protein subunit M [Geodermatophilus sp. DF01_2]